IKDRLEKHGKRPEEPKANVSVEGLDAVQILTVHSAKGLEFPIVFLPGLDEELKASKKQGEILAMEIGSDRLRLAYQPDNTLRKYHPLFIADRERQKEEERHLFYVGVTRARDALFLTASETNRKTKESRLSWLLDHIDPDEPPVLPGFTVKREETPEEEVLIAEKEESFKKSPVPLEPCFFQEIPVPEGEFQSVTSSLEKGEGNVSWKFFGEVMHQILDDISRGYMKPFPEEVKKRFLRLAYPLPISGAVSLAEEAVRQMQILLSSPAGEIILPQPDGFSEVPVIFVEGSTHISGRIDRLIIKQDTIFIYDYKTGPIGSTEIVPAVNYYSAQLRTYRKALELIYPGRMVKMFLIFTYTGEVRGC
ncbi:MAG: hypothetical protein COX46_03625, partial [bacterium (Candidatus Ratteibacteria) CG23_combo_of_CG06-09_8_20_14_all_48_7]